MHEEAEKLDRENEEGSGRTTAFITTVDRVITCTAIGTCVGFVGRVLADLTS